ncbi:hypothetical protein [Rubricoccus marinus]|uniref:Uncharacterized protein n=1 Tax=Rubricoccus marinus TaxID=716817 RepID=A0A259U1W6_9BACT|nr:hypothetical protein [Rubricoccus marinus]OZC03972.1 hypothetical protein BSZ36_13865 [Rubricoccus marinus]
MADATDKVDTPIGHTETWPELAIGLWDKLTGRGAVIEYTFEDFNVSVPSGAGKNATHADWKMSGTLRIRTRDEEHGGALNSN